MADTYTAVLILTKPEIGGSDNTWGQKQNDNLDDLDAAVVSDRARLTTLETATAGTLGLRHQKVEKGSVSGAVSIDLALGAFQRLTLGGNTTLSFTNVPASPTSSLVFLEITGDSGIGYTVTWPGGTLGQPPTIFGFGSKSAVGLLFYGSTIICVVNKANL